jgi:hypothetical protein
VADVVALLTALLPTIPPAPHPNQFVVAEPGRALARELTNRKLRRSAHRSVTELEADVRQWD